METNQLNQSAAPGQIIRRAQVMLMTGIQSKTTLYRWCAEGIFPAPVKLGPRASGWYQNDVQRWVDSRRSV